MQIRVLSELKPHPLNAEIYGDGCNDELLALIQENVVKDEYALIITGDQAYCGAMLLSQDIAGSMPHKWHKSTPFP
jgi:hypothetical protein